MVLSTNNNSGRDLNNVSNYLPNSAIKSHRFQWDLKHFSSFIIKLLHHVNNCVTY